MSKNDGGPAFPATVANGCNGGVTGMSLRDWFAGQALCGMMTGVVGQFATGAIAAYRYGECNEVMVQRAYAAADAMLAARGAP